MNSRASADKEVQILTLTKGIESNFNLVICDKPNKKKTSALKVIEIQNWAGWDVSTSVVAAIIKDVMYLMKKKEMLVQDKPIFPEQLQKKIDQLERNGAVPSTLSAYSVTWQKRM